MACVLEGFEISRTISFLLSLPFHLEMWHHPITHSKHDMLNLNMSRPTEPIIDGDL